MVAIVNIVFVFVFLIIENIENTHTKKSPTIPNLEITIVNTLEIIFPVFLPSLDNIYDI